MGVVFSCRIVQVLAGVSRQAAAQLRVVEGPAVTRQQLEARVVELEARNRELEKQCTEASKKFAMENHSE